MQNIKFDTKGPILHDGKTHSANWLAVFVFNWYLLCISLSHEYSWRINKIGQLVFSRHDENMFKWPQSYTVNYGRAVCSCTNAHTHSLYYIHILHTMRCINDLIMLIVQKAFIRKLNFIVILFKNVYDIGDNS